MLDNIKNIFEQSKVAKATFLIATHFGVFTPFVANAEPKDNPADSALTEYSSQTKQAQIAAYENTGNYGYESQKNIGIALFFGSDNKGTPDQFGQYLVKKIKVYALEEHHLIVEPAYFVINNPDGPKGIRLQLQMGPKAIDNINFMEAIKEKNLEKIIQTRIEANKLLNK